VRDPCRFRPEGARRHRLQPCQSGSLGKSGVFSPGRCRPRHSIAEQSEDAPVRLVRMGLPDPRAGNVTRKMHPDFFSLEPPGQPAGKAATCAELPLAPLLTRRSSWKTRPIGAIAQLETPCKNILDCRPTEEGGILDLDPVVRQSLRMGAPCWRSPLGRWHS